MAEVGSLGYHEPVRHVPGELTVQNHFTLVVLRTVTLALDRRRLHHRRRYARGVPGYSERHFVPKPFPGGAWEGSKNQRRRADSNRRMEVLQTSALPLGYGAGKTEGARPSPSPPQERETGLEPATPTLARWCSTN